MSHALVAGRHRFEIEGRRKFGRDDLPNEAAMSRAHFEIVAKRGRLYVRDLRSRNGTLVDGQPLEPDVPTLVQPGSRIRVGQTDFLVKGREAGRAAPATLFMDALAFAALAALLLGGNENAFGRALGPVGLGIVAGALLVSVLVSAAACGFFLPTGGWSPKRAFAYGVAVTLSSGLIYTGLLMGAEKKWQVSATWMPAKIEYHCLTKFEPMACSRQVHACPECVTQIDRYKREQMVRNLAPYRPRTASARNTR